MRVMSRKPPAARRSRARVLLGPLVGQAHQRGRGEVRHVRHHGDQRVVALGREGDHLGAERRHDRRARARRPASSVLAVGREHPHRALEQVGVGAVDALLLGAGHRVAADEAGVGRRRRRSSAFTLPTSVTMPGWPPAAARAASAAIGAHGRGDERDLGVGVEADGVERAELEGPRGARPRRRRRR